LAAECASNLELTLKGADMGVPLVLVETGHSTPEGGTALHHSRKSHRSGDPTKAQGLSPSFMEKNGDIPSGMGSTTTAILRQELGAVLSCSVLEVAVGLLRYLKGQHLSRIDT